MIGEVLKKLISKTLKRPYFRPDTDHVVPIPAKYLSKNPKLLLLLGENASGKSVFRRLLVGLAQQDEIFAIHLSLEKRCQGDMGFARMVIYGSEQDDSTGSNSVKAFLGALRTSRGSDKPHILVLDEPEIGLSESWIASLGVGLKAYLADPPEHLLGVAIVTHSKLLVTGLLPLNPSSVLFGYQTLTEWLESKPVIRPLEDLLDANIRRYRLVQKAKPKR